MIHRSRATYRLSLLAAMALSAAPPAQALCYSSPAAALDALHQPSSTAAVQDGGYRITGIQSDPVLGQRWALITSCTHPEWPALALPIRGPQDTTQSRLESTPLAPVIHIGDTVRLWRQEAFLRIETAGIAEENGYPGRTIRVRLLHRSEDRPDQSDQPFLRQPIAGIVRGPADVEMQP